MEFDATLKDLARESPADFLAALDEPPKRPLSLINVDLSTVTKAADLVVGLGKPLEEIIHLDFQSAASKTKHADVLVYNSLLFRHYLVPVHSILVLLRPQAQHRNLDGTVSYAARPNRGKMDFNYEVVKLWEIPVEKLTSGGIGALPLAPLGKLPEDVPEGQALADVIRLLVNRFTAEAPPDRAKNLLTATFILLGLRVRRETAKQLLKEAQGMKESDTYMAILEEGEEKGLQKGRQQEARELILRLGQKRFGAADQAIKDRLAATDDTNLLEDLAERILDVDNWQELFQ